MCTLTAWRGSSGYFLVMNRDERRCRADELPPKTDSGSGMIAPRDGEAGGTWIGLNPGTGMTACLLNLYGRGNGLSPADPANRRSRGELIPEALRHRRLCHVEEWIRTRRDWTQYGPFLLIVFAPEGARRWSWDRHDPPSARDLPEGWTMHTSSSWNTQAVEAWRHRLFARWQEEEATGREPSVNLACRFNVISNEGHREWTPLMTRPESATRSITTVHHDTFTQQPSMHWTAVPGATDGHPAKELAAS